MSYSDSFSDTVTRIRNGQMARLLQVDLVYSKMGLALLKILKDEGYIVDFEEIVVKSKRNFSFKGLRASLKYSGSDAAISKIVRISKPGRRVYSSVSKICGFRNGLGMIVLSTPKGVITDRAARKLGVGGEVLCGVF
ncbi:30S ribosomal protein S8 [Rickettsiales bacterium]|nr:30S ribosomal protein S8 [Rickettsiales bacterium]